MSAVFIVEYTAGHSNCAVKKAGTQEENRKTNETIEWLPIQMRMGYNLFIDHFVLI